ncbi:MAG: recombinase family protein [bacterium]|nr:recombinase family protein [bacterium]
MKWDRGETIKKQDKAYFCLLKEKLESSKDYKDYKNYIGKEGLEALLQDVLSGEIHEIHADSLFSFGSDFSEIGYYLERLLPKLNVRVFASEENYDSARTEDREWLKEQILSEQKKQYAREHSRKLQEAKAKRGEDEERGLAKVPYGYLRSEDGKRLLLDEEVAPYVRMIFQWALLGVSRQETASRLNLLGLATPGQRKKTGQLHVALNETKWTVGAVQKILSNPAYSGDLVRGKLKQSLYQGIRQHPTKPEEWRVLKQQHVPMLARDDWEEWKQKQSEGR